jgi:hypothetical protein
LCIALLVIIAPIVSLADEPESTEYVVRCDRHDHQLTITEAKFDYQTAKAGITKFTIKADTLTKIGGTDAQPLLLPARRKIFKCQLGKASYRVVVEPYIFNARIMGECGAAPPSISLSVSRDGKQIFSKINFEDCRTGRTINRIQVNESEKSTKVLALLNPYSLPIQVERTYQLLSFPMDWEQAIFEDFPTGDLDADIFIAVYKRDVDFLQQVIQKGANVNTKDLNGFPPLALIGTGRQDAFRNKKLDEFNNVSEKMAKLLFAAGAKGDATNKNGVTLLDCLIGTVPTTVIEMMLTNGANAKDGNSIKQAALHADEKLMSSLIKAGADFNKKGPDRTTALWTASTSGFYTWSGRSTPSIDEYAKCIRLLLQNGAKVQDAVSDSEGLLWLLVSSFGKDERLRIILKELLPYTDRDAIKRADKIAPYTVNQMFEEYRR